MIFLLYKNKKLRETRRGEKCLKTQLKEGRQCPQSAVDYCSHLIRYIKILRGSLDLVKLQSTAWSDLQTTTVKTDKFITGVDVVVNS